MKCFKLYKRKIFQKRSRAAIAGTIVIFMVSFLVFCICAVDVGHTVTSRYKTQKITETISLYMASYINSLSLDNRNKDSLTQIKKNFETLYSNNEITGNYKFKISDIEIHANDSSVKIKVATETSIPTLFLRYAGFGTINIKQISYAKATQVQMPEIDSDENSYTFKAKEIITDKKGNDVEIIYNGDYLVFAGLDIKEKEPVWIDIGSLSNNEAKIPFIISNTDSNYNALCISGNSSFDFANDPNKTIGLAQYIKIIKVDNCKAQDTELDSESSDTIETEPESPDISESNQENSEETENSTDNEETGIKGDDPVVTILNSAKIIRKSEFNQS